MNGDLSRFVLRFDLVEETGHYSNQIDELFEEIVGFCPLFSNVRR